MRVAVMDYSFAPAIRDGRMDTPAAIRFCHELGADAMELMDSLVNRAGMAATEEALTETATSVCCYDVACDFLAPEDRARAAAVDGARQALQRAARFGSPCVLVVPGAPRPGVSPATSRGWIVDCLRALAPDAQALGLTLTMEHRGLLAEVYGSSANLKAIAEAVPPVVGATCDLGNCLLASETGAEAVRSLGAHIAHVHAKDWVPADDDAPGAAAALDGRRYAGVALGEGVVDLAAGLAALAAVGYDGCVSVEYEGPEDPRAAVRRGVRHLRTLLGRLSAGG